MIIVVGIILGIAIGGKICEETRNHVTGPIVVGLIILAGAVCYACGRRGAPGAKFCGNCGKPLRYP